jgi:hypothetical protein
MVKLACFIILLLIQSSLLAQKIPLRKVKPILSFPIKLTNGGIIIFDALVANKPDTLHFIFDTGSGAVSLDSSVVAKYEITPKQNEKRIRGIGGIKKLQVVDNVPFQIGALTIKDMQFYVVDYSSISAYYGINISGIIGFELLAKYVVKVDYDNLKMHLYPINAYKYGPGKTIMADISSIPTIETFITDNNSNKGKYIFDSGGGMSIMLADEFNKDSSIIKPNRKKVKSYTEGFGGRSEVEITVIDKLNLYGYKFKNVPVYLYKDSVNVINYPVRKGIIGNDLLRKFNTIFNYATGEIHLTPNKSYLEPFDYGYTGLDLYLVQDKIYAGAIAEGSPAHTAGIQENDLIFGMNNNFSGNIDEYKSLLEKYNTTIKIFIRRNNELIQVNLKVGSIK